MAGRHHRTPGRGSCVPFSPRSGSAPLDDPAPRRAGKGKTTRDRARERPAGPGSSQGEVKSFRCTAIIGSRPRPPAGTRRSRRPALTRAHPPPAGAGLAAERSRRIGLGHPASRSWARLRVTPARTCPPMCSNGHIHPLSRRPRAGAPAIAQRGPKLAGFSLCDTLSTPKTRPKSCSTRPPAPIPPRAWARRDRLTTPRARVS
jgi:hypothetical protein